MHVLPGAIWKANTGEKRGENETSDQNQETRLPPVNGCGVGRVATVFRGDLQKEPRWVFETVVQQLKSGGEKPQVTYSSFPVMAHRY